MAHRLEGPRQRRARPPSASRSRCCSASNFEHFACKRTLLDQICFNGRKINLSGVFAGQNVGIKQVAEKVWLMSFMQYDLGFFDDESIRVECAPNPFEVKVLPMSPE